MKKPTTIIIAIILLTGIVFGQSLWSDFIKTEFTITDVVPICDRENYVWKEWDDSAGVLSEWDALTSCYEPEGIPKICCPEGYKCGYTLPPTEDNYMKCYESTQLIEYCEDYINDTECESAPPEIAARSIDMAGDTNTPEGVCEEGYSEINSSDPNCIRYSSCMCYWDHTEGKCSAGVEYSGWYCDYPGVDPEEPNDDDGICVLKKGSVVGNCQEDDFIRITWNREWVGTGSPPSECSGSFTRNIPCPTRLIFFTILSFALTVIMITGAYAFLRYKKRR